MRVHHHGVAMTVEHGMFELRDPTPELDFTRALKLARYSRTQLAAIAAKHGIAPCSPEHNLPVARRRSHRVFGRIGISVAHLRRLTQIFRRPRRKNLETDRRQWRLENVRSEFHSFVE